MLKTFLLGAVSFLWFGICASATAQCECRSNFKTKTIDTWCLVDVTSYTNHIDETDNSPNITSIGVEVQEGYLAISNDLLSHIPYESSVCLLGKRGVTGCYMVMDTMSKRFTYRADIFRFSKYEARQIGKSKAWLHFKRT